MLQAARMRIHQNHHSFFQDLTVYTALLLLARCGMRISEPPRLKRHHYQSEERTLCIEKTKFGKQRLIPLPAATALEIENYLAARRTLQDGNSNPFLLPGKGDRPLPTGRIYSLFKKAVSDIGQAQPRRIVADLVFGAPTPHSLRHSFAVNTLKAAKQRGQTPGRILPVLSAYLGHRKYRYTAVYLKVIDAEQRQGLVNFAVARQEEP
jgi:integrase